MAGFLKVFFIGSTGGFMGSDGLARPFIQIFQGESDRQWLEPVYEDDKVRPMASLECLVPARPDDPVALLDAAIAFLPQEFEKCPSFKSVERQLQSITRLDFDEGKNVPRDWGKLRREALPIFRTFGVFEANLQPVDVASITAD
ncbi:MAG: hypothetical protein NVS1B4_26770 [Gemmatimonadaceae bacterium]